jgi:endonuclease YncB( thermonuclease family)
MHRFPAPLAPPALFLLLSACKGLDVVPIFTTDTCAFDGLESASREVYVARTLDGDTFETDTGESVRLLGINTPEIAHPEQAEECWGPESADWLAEELTGLTVQLTFDKECTDIYGRTLAYVRTSTGYVALDTADTGSSTATLDWDVLVNEQSVRLGESVVYEDFDDVKLATVLYDAQAVAEREGAGLWGVCESS